MLSLVTDPFAPDSVLIDEEAALLLWSRSETRSLAVAIESLWSLPGLSGCSKGMLLAVLMLFELSERLDRELSIAVGIRSEETVSKEEWVESEGECDDTDAVLVKSSVYWAEGVLDSRLLLGVVESALELPAATLLQ